MSQQKTTIHVSCNNQYCNFSANYPNDTLEEIRKYREFWSKIPVIDNECSHADCTITEVK